MTCGTRLALVAALLPMPAAADLVADTRTWTCARGVSVPVTTVTEAEQSLVVLTIEGRQITLYAEDEAARRYGWPSDGSSYVWVTDGESATVYWKDGVAGTETVILADCAPA